MQRSRFAVHVRRLDQTALLRRRWLSLSRGVHVLQTARSLGLLELGASWQLGMPPLRWCRPAPRKITTLGRIGLGPNQDRQILRRGRLADPSAISRGTPWWLAVGGHRSQGRRGGRQREQVPSIWPRYVELR